MHLPSKRISVALAALALATTTAVAPTAAASDAGSKLDPRLFVEPGATSAIVHLADEAGTRRAVEIAENLGIDVGSRWNAIHAFLAIGRRAEFEALAALPFVEYVEADAPLEFMTETSHRASRSANLLDGEVTLADGTVIDGSGVGVAVIDTGIEGTHPDLAPNMGGNVKIVCPASTWGVAGTGFPYSTCRVPNVAVPMDDTDTPSAGGHGTHVASIIAGTGAASDGRFRGAAPGATLYGISVGYFLTTGDVVDGLNWVLQNHDQVSPAIKVVNNSWGGTPEPYDGPNQLHRAIWDMQEALVDEGVTMVMAAGNAGGGAGMGATVTGPCVNPTPGVICVANYNDGDTGGRDGAVHGTSSRGRWHDPASWPDISAPGTHITAACRTTLPVCTMLNEAADGGENYATLTGTSMAAPEVSGIVAQLLQANPTLSPAEIENLLEDTAYKFAPGSEYGLFVDPFNPENSSSYEKGHGLVDALAAVRVALGLDAPPGPSTFPPGPPDTPEATASGFVAHWPWLASITEQEFANTCLMVSHETPFGNLDVTPVSNGIDGYVMRIPANVVDLPELEARMGASNPIEFHDVSVTYYDAACKPLGGSIANAETRHEVPDGARYVFINPGLLAYATNVYAEFYDATPVDVGPVGTTLSLVTEGRGSSKILVATLQDPTGTGLEGKRIDFYADGASIGHAITGTGGRAELAVPSRYRSSQASFSATFAGDEDYSPSSSS